MCLVPEILRFHYLLEKPSKKPSKLMMSVVCSLVENILSKQGERLEMICAALINLSEVVFRHIVLMELHFLLCRPRPIFLLSPEMINDRVSPSFAQNKTISPLKLSEKT